MFWVDFCGDFESLVMFFVLPDFGGFEISVIDLHQVADVFTVRTKTFTNKRRRSNQ